MELRLCCLAPHAPIIIEDVGGAESAKVAGTASALGAMADAMAAVNPDVVVIISPHGPVFADAVGLLYADELAGDLGQFGAPQLRQRYVVDKALTEAVAAECEANRLPAGLVSAQGGSRGGAKRTLDHGILVPLHFPWAIGLRPRLVAMGPGYLPFEDLYAIGRCIRRAIEGAGPGTAVLIASGDLSHRLTPDANAGYDADAHLFDEWLMRELGRPTGPDPLVLTAPDRALLERAGECGYRSVVMMLGALDATMVAPKVLSYEGPFGVGYGVALFEPRGQAPSVYGDLRDRATAAVQSRRAGETPPVALARATVERWVTTGEGPEGARVSTQALPGLPARAAVFVSIKRHGELRGCIGTTQPTRDSVADEIAQNAISAATQDPRFDAVTADELADLVYSVDVLTPPAPIAGPEQLDPARYGVIVSSRGRTGLLLPDLDGIDTVEKQVAVAKRKAGLGDAESVSLQRFEVVRFR